MNEIPAAGRISTLVLELGTSERVWECSAMSQGVTRLQPPTNTPASSRIGASNAERDSSVLERTGSEKFSRGIQRSTNQSTTPTAHLGRS